MLTAISPSERRLYDELKRLRATDRGAFKRAIMSMQPSVAERLLYDWEGLYARPKQLEPDDPRWMYWLITAGRAFGKLQCKRTPLPTPSGWQEIGDIEIGSHVFGPDGKPTLVTGVYDSTPERAYRLTFSDGTTLDVGGEHLWTTWTARDRKEWNRSKEKTGPLPERWWEWVHIGQHGKPTGAGPATRDTDEIVRTLRYGKRGDRNHSIPTCEPLDLACADLLIDPWVLGYWLGNGSARGGRIFAHGDDGDGVVERIVEAGFGAHWIWQRDVNCKIVNTQGLTRSLRRLGVLRNKHVPDAYLWASVDQRLALLRGLMDSDGHAQNSHAEFCTTTKPLADAVLHLCRSLGEKPSMYEGRATLDGRDMGPKWRVCWTPCRSNPFMLPRKEATVSLGPRPQASKLFHRMIVKAEPIDPVPMRCIEVDNDSRLYLAGEGMIPTHNTRTGSETVRMWAEKKLYDYILIAGRTAGDVRSLQIEGPSGILRVSPPWFMPKYEPSKRLLTWPNGVIAEIRYGDSVDGFRGFSGGGAWLDELFHWSKAEDAFDNLTLGMREAKASRIRILITSTPTPCKLVRQILADKKDGITYHTEGSTLENRANLNRDYINNTVRRLQGSRRGKQEIEGQILEDVPGAIWKDEWIRPNKVVGILPEYDLCVIAVDPAVSEDGPSAETGIVVGVRCSDKASALFGHILIVEDATAQYSPEGWADKVAKLFYAWSANYVVAEVNQGGNLVVSNIQLRDGRIPVKKIHAKQGKRLRAEPIVSQDELGMIHHWLSIEENQRDHDKFGPMEHQMTQVDPNNMKKAKTLDDASGDRYDRVDARVYACHFLIFGEVVDAGSMLDGYA